MSICEHCKHWKEEAKLNTRSATRMHCSVGSWRDVNAHHNESGVYWEAKCRHDPRMLDHFEPIKS